MRPPRDPQPGNPRFRPASRPRPPFGRPADARRPSRPAPGEFLAAQPARARLTPEALAVKLLSLARPEVPLDTTVRDALASLGRIPRDVGSEATRLVFLVQRWKGWLPARASWAEQIHLAHDLAGRYAENPATLPAADLMRAVPGWTPAHVDVTPEWLRTLQVEPVLWLRARPGRAAELGDLAADTTPYGPLAPDALRYSGPQDLFRTEAFHAGRFEIQDVASQLVSLLAAPKPGESWWDACAGEGGKTMHLADLLGNKGTVWATDRAAWRLQRLKLRAARAGLFNVRRAVWEGGPKRPDPTPFDGVLVDAPCSGIGTWQRNPHARWSTTPKDIAELAPRQLALLTAAARGLKPGGRLVYAVCTLSHEETTGVAAAFEKACPEFQPLPAPFAVPGVPAGTPAHHVWMWPQHAGGNGMFVALWRRAPR